jgi:hypothetical protein
LIFFYLYSILLDFEKFAFWVALVLGMYSKFFRKLILSKQMISLLAWKFWPNKNIFHEMHIFLLRAVGQSEKRKGSSHPRPFEGEGFTSVSLTWKRRGLPCPPLVPRALFQWQT